MTAKIIKSDYAGIKKVEEFNWERTEQFVGYPAGEESMMDGKEQTSQASQRRA